MKESTVNTHTNVQYRKEYGMIESKCNHSTHRLKSLQKTNTKESGSLRVIERTKRTINAAIGALEPSGLSIIIRDAASEKDGEIVRLRRKLIATQTRLERLSRGVIPRLRSKANEVRELRKKLNPENTTGRKQTPREILAAKRSQETRILSKF